MGELSRPIKYPLIKGMIKEGENGTKWSDLKEGEILFTNTLYIVNSILHYDGKDYSR